MCCCPCSVISTSLGINCKKSSDTYIFKLIFDNNLIKMSEDTLRAHKEVSAKPPYEVINLSTLPNLNIQQLTMFKQQLDKELEVFQDSLHTLKIAQSKFQESGACLEKITQATEGNEILVPLTGSMYVTGRLADANNVMVDVGTGYYAKKSIDDGKDYFKRKVDYVTEQMEKIQQVGIERTKLREATMDIIDAKIQPLGKKIVD